MSSCIAVEPYATPSTVADPITRLDALFGVFRYARLLSSPPMPTDADTNAAVMTDWRIVRETGPLVHSDILSKVLWFVGESIEVNASETLMVVSYDFAHGNMLHLHSLPGGKRLRTIGEEGSGPGQFIWPKQVCFGPGDVIIAADRGNERLQVFSSTGKYLRSIHVRGASGICISNNPSQRMIGVATDAAAVVLLEYASGTVLRTISEELDTWVSGARFTPDDSHILTVEYSTTLVKMFSVADGSFVRSVCEGLGPKNGDKDLCFASNGDIVVADSDNYRVCVFTPDGSTLKRHFGSEGGGDSKGQFRRPTTLSLVNGRLYVLDSEKDYVQVFV